MPIHALTRMAFHPFSWVAMLLLWIVTAQAAPIGYIPRGEADSGGAAGFEFTEILDDDPFSVMDQLDTVSIGGHSFLEDDGEDPVNRAAVTDRFEMATGGIGGLRFSVIDVDRRGAGLDRGATFDERKGFDERAAQLDRGGSVDVQSGFDSLGAFDKESIFQFGKRRVLPLLQSGREEKLPRGSEKEGQSLFSPREESEGRDESALRRREPEGNALMGEKESLEKDLLRSERIGMRSVRPGGTSYFVKIGAFLAALVLLLAGMLKGILPLKVYFFLTIVILIFWNPMESLFITVILALAALLAPVLG